MVRAGIVMNLVGVVVITALIYLLGLAVFGIDLSAVPDWV